MDTGQLVLLGVIGAIVQYAIIYFAVYNATSVLRQYAKIQAALLCHMARKEGVTEEELQGSYDLK